MNKETSACTNDVEGLNSGLKRRIPVRNRTSDDIDAHLGEYIYGEGKIKGNDSLNLLTK